MSDWGDAEPESSSPNTVTDEDVVRECVQTLLHALQEPQLRAVAAEGLAPLVEALGDPKQQSAPPLQFETLPAFLEGYFFKVYRRRVDGASRRWSRSWFESAEAVIRLEALWRAWEHLRQDPALGMSVWLRDHVDPHMAVLLSPDGPFATTGYDEGSKSDDEGNLPYSSPPVGMFVPA